MFAPHPPRRHGARPAADPALPAVHGGTDVPHSIAPAASRPAGAAPHVVPRGRRQTAATLAAGLTRALVGASVEGGA